MKNPTSDKNQNISQKSERDVNMDDEIKMFKTILKNISNIGDGEYFLSGFFRKNGFRPLGHQINVLKYILQLLNIPVYQKFWKGKGRLSWAIYVDDQARVRIKKFLDMAA